MVAVATLLTVLFGLVFFLLPAFLLMFLIKGLGAPGPISRLGHPMLRLASRAAGGSEVCECRDGSFEMGNFSERPPVKNRSWSLGGPFGVTHEIDEGVWGDAVVEEPSKDYEEIKEVGDDYEGGEVKVVKRDDKRWDEYYIEDEVEVGNRIVVYIPRVTEKLASFSPAGMLEDSEKESVVEQGGDTGGFGASTLLKTVVVALLLGAVTGLVFFGLLV